MRKRINVQATWKNEAGSLQVCLILAFFLHQDSGVETKTGSESNPSEMDGWIQICITLNTNPDPLKTPTKDKT